MKKQFVDLDNAREEDQKEVMRNIVEADHCPFCLENLRRYHKEPIIKSGKYWLLTTNQWPYKNTKHHFLIIYKEHATTLSELDPNAGKELLEFVAWLEEKYQISGGGWAMRFGDTQYSAGSVNHIHAQLIQPDVTKPDFKPVRFKIGKD